MDMDFFEVLRNRHSIRAFKKKDVEQEKINIILESANLAPSAGDLQAYEIVVIRDQERRLALAEAALNQDFIAQAPLNLVFFINPRRSAKRYGQRGIRLYCLQDATIAAAYSQLAATALGLGSVWTGAFYEEPIMKLANAKEDLIPVAIISIGYPDEEPEVTPRRRIEDFVHDEYISNPYKYKPSSLGLSRPT
ncbi:MAG: nitroreductase family protein [Nitrososphaerales archaeon]